MIVIPPGDSSCTLPLSTSAWTVVNQESDSDSCYSFTDVTGPSSRSSSVYVKSHVSSSIKSAECNIEDVEREERRRPEERKRIRHAEMTERKGRRIAEEKQKELERETRV